MLAKGGAGGQHSSTPLKRLTKPCSQDAGSTRKRPRERACNTTFSSLASQERAGASAAMYDRAGTIKMQPSGQSRGCASTNTDPTNPFHDPTSSYLTPGLPTEPHVFSPPFSPVNYHDVNIAATPQSQHQQHKQSADPKASRTLAAMSGNSAQDRNSPESPSTLAPSESSISPGPSRRRNASRPAEEPKSHSCEKCTKNFPRACDLK